jgi:hypothetical protein
LKVTYIKDVFLPDNSLEWMQNYAQIPYGLVCDDLLHVYFSSRETRDSVGNFKSYTGLVRLDLENDFRVYDVSQEPLLDLGSSGSFDEYGVMPGSVVKKSDSEFVMFYCGWSRPLNFPYKWSIGIAESQDGLRFKRKSEIPLDLDSGRDLFACPMVYGENDMEMYYLSSEGWVSENGRVESLYLVRKATSIDGLNWKTTSHSVVEKTYDLECQTSPSVFVINGHRFMFYSYRHATEFRNNPSKNYRTGLAREKLDGVWEKSGPVEFLHKGEIRFDIAYANVFEYSGSSYVLYNLSEGFGTSGIFLGKIGI